MSMTTPRAWEQGGLIDPVPKPQRSRRRKWANRLIALGLLGGLLAALVIAVSLDDGGQAGREGWKARIVEDDGSGIAAAFRTDTDWGCAQLEEGFVCQGTQGDARVAPGSRSQLSLGDPLLDGYAVSVRYDSLRWECRKLDAGVACVLR